MSHNRNLLCISFLLIAIQAERSRFSGRKLLMFEVRTIVSNIVMRVLFAVSRLVECRHEFVPG